jgi:hypothetical protein
MPMIESLDLDALAAVVGGRVTNDGADPALIDSVTDLTSKVQKVGSSLVELQQQFDQQMFPLFMQMLAPAQPVQAEAAPAPGNPLEGIL